MYDTSTISVLMISCTTRLCVITDSDIKMNTVSASLKSFTQRSRVLRKNVSNHVHLHELQNPVTLLVKKEFSFTWSARFKVAIA